jgi:hypothetical protein
MNTCPEWPDSDPIDNIMGYVNKCYATFTSQQVELMQLVYEKYRQARPGFCYLDVFITFNANPNDITIHISSDNIYFAQFNGTDYTPNEAVILPIELDHGKGVRGMVVARRQFYLAPSLWPESSESSPEHENTQ